MEKREIGGKKKRRRKRREGKEVKEGGWHYGIRRRTGGERGVFHPTQVHLIEDLHGFLQSMPSTPQCRTMVDRS